MSRSTKRDQRKIGRMAKYVKGLENPRGQPEFQFEALDTTLTVHTDSESAVCRSSREEHARCRGSGIHNVCGRQAMEFHTEVSGVVVV